jgi:type II secretory pathway pseudopilin PulG
MADRMHNPAAALRRPARRPVARRGFSFAEVMFAVIILAIGFILVAAIFPVAIQQTQSTAEDAAAAAAAREAANAITGLPTAVPNPLYNPTATTAMITTNPPIAVRQLLLFPPTVKNYVPPTTIGTGAVPPPAIVVPFTGPRAEMARGNLVNASDPRYAYVPFYRRENGSSVAQLIVIAVTARNRPVFDPIVDTVVPSNYPSTACTGTVTPHTAVSASSTYYTICPDLISFTSPPTWLGEGCSLLTSTTTGRSYRLGRAVTTTTPPTQFELDPGDNLSVAPGSDGLWGSYGVTATDPTNDVIDTTFNSNTAVPTGTLQPVSAYAAVYTAAGSLGGRITLSADLAHVFGASASNVAPAMAVPGTFVIVADDYPYLIKQPTLSPFQLPLNNSAANPDLVVGAYNGRVFRLGQPVPANSSSTPVVPPGTFELDPAYPMPAVPSSTSPYLIPTTGINGPLARVYLVGAGRTNPLSTNDTTAAQQATTLTTYSGNAQDTGVYTTFFPVQ